MPSLPDSGSGVLPCQPHWGYNQLCKSYVQLWKPHPWFWTKSGAKGITHCLISAGFFSSVWGVGSPKAPIIVKMILKMSYLPNPIYVLDWSMFCWWLFSLFFSSPRARRLLSGNLWQRCTDVEKEQIRQAILEDGVLHTETRSFPCACALIRSTLSLCV